MSILAQSLRSIWSNNFITKIHVTLTPKMHHNKFGHIVFKKKKILIVGTRLKTTKETSCKMSILIKIVILNFNMIYLLNSLNIFLTFLTFFTTLHFFFKVGEQLISNFSKRRQCTLQCEGRTALLTLWGQKSDDEIIPGVYEVYAVRPTNDFNGQRSYNSTPSTAFKVTAWLISVCSFNDHSSVRTSIF